MASTLGTPPGAIATSARSDAQVVADPMSPASSDKTRLSLTIVAARRTRLAPRAVCTARSGRLISPRTSNRFATRSEEHTSELQSLRHLVCRLLLEKKKQKDRKLQRLRKNKQR